MKEPNFEEELKFYKKNKILLVGGIDEAGRGPLAGPVVASLVCFNKKNISEILSNKNYIFLKDNLTDSKKINPKKREKLSWQIKDIASFWDIITVSSEIIDEINILNATLFSFKKLAINFALHSINKKLKPVFLIDGNKKIPSLDFKQKTILKGDNKSFSIAAASILAKTTRDRLMLDYHFKYPKYNFDKHKGYGTKLHYENLKKYGPCPIHRRSFRLK